VIDWLIDSTAGMKWEWVIVCNRIGVTQSVRLLNHGDICFDQQHDRKQEMRTAMVKKSWMRILCSILALIVTHNMLIL
jgi:hypothetical protein